MRTEVLVHGADHHEHHRIVLSSVVRRDSEDERTGELRMPECTQTTDRYEHTAAKQYFFQSLQKASWMMDGLPVSGNIR